VCLQGLPEALSTLTRLNVLAADQNRIATVPPVLLKGCSSLRTLALHENPITIQAAFDLLAYLGWMPYDTSCTLQDACKKHKCSHFAANYRLRAWMTRLIWLFDCASICHLASISYACKHRLTIVRCNFLQVLEATDGYELLEDRRRMKVNKQIANGVLLGSAGLDEGIHRDVNPRGESPK
jgi:Leucine-rich repeat (LRR) protein